jgi:hypothetical protein
VFRGPQLTKNWVTTNCGLDVATAANFPQLTSFDHNALGHIDGSERASGEGDTENLPTVWAETDIVPFDERVLFRIHVDLAQFLLTVWGHRGVVCLDDFDFRHGDHVLLFGAYARAT